MYILWFFWSLHCAHQWAHGKPSSNIVSNADRGCRARGGINWVISYLEQSSACIKYPLPHTFEVSALYKGMEEKNLFKTPHSPCATLSPNTGYKSYHRLFNMCIIIYMTCTMLVRNLLVTSCFQCVFPWWFYPSLLTSIVDKVSVGRLGGLGFEP